MIHPSDAEVLCNLLRVSDIPQGIEDEYEIWRGMYHSGGGTGMLGIRLLIPLLRQLGYARPDDPRPVNVDWRKQIGEPIDAVYGDQKISGTLTGLGTGGELVCLLDGVDGEVELPRHLVTLGEKKRASKGSRK